MAKHLLYLTNNQLSALIWDKGVFSDAQIFDNYASGWSKFADYLQEHTKIPVFFLTDLIEEDFQRDSIPHVYGTARKNLVERRLNALYRDTPYRDASYQGRAKEGRKDDQMLFSALTNPQLLKPWVDALQALKIDIAGIYSVALLNSYLFKRLGLDKQASLLVTHQSSGLRQSFFQDGYLRFSRLAPETAWSAESIAETTDKEIGKTRQFLASTRQLARGAPLEIVVLAQEDILSRLRARPLSEDGAHYRFVHLHEARQIFKMPAVEELLHCDPFFLALLAKQNIASHYATESQRRTHSLSQLRGTLNGLSVITLAVALFWSGSKAFDAYDAHQMAQQAKIETLSALARYQETTNSMPATVANPMEMRAAVELHKMLSNNAPVPTNLLSNLSQVLASVPQIKIHELHWQSSETDGSVAVDPNSVPAPPGDGSLAVLPGPLGIPKRPFEILLIEAEVLPFKNDYRSAVERVELLVDELKKQLQKDTYLQISIVTPPIDTRPSVKLESQIGNDEALAKPLFSLKIIWKP